MWSRTLLLAYFSVFILGCSSQESTASKSQREEQSGSDDITEEQQSALDALNYLQVNTQYHLHSTFVNAEPHCSPPDTTFMISQEDFHAALTRFADQYYDGSPEPLPNILRAAVLAQEDYYVEHCYTVTANPKNYVRESGTWILRGVLDLRDVIIEW